jgi:5-methylcytosine-specific restriction endonuclease McrA
MEDNRIIPLHLSGQDTEAKRIYQEKRRQKKLTLDDTLTNKQWVFALDFFGHRCAYCGSNNSLEEEHIVPVSKDGAREASNIIPACSSCNSSKRDKDLSDWLNSRFTKRDVKTVTKRIDEYISATFNGGSAP